MINVPRTHSRPFPPHLDTNPPGIAVQRNQDFGRGRDEQEGTEGTVMISGAPEPGKGTQCEPIGEKFGLSHILQRLASSGGGCGAEIYKMGDHLENEEKARANPEKFLRERFQNAPRTDLITLKLQTQERRVLHEAAVALKVAASPLDLVHVSVVAPKLGDGRTPAADKWVVVGLDKSSVGEKVQEVSREAARVKQRIQEEREEPVARAMKASAPNDKVWDVGGLWDITFKGAKNGWESKNYKGSLDIRFPQRSGEGAQIWGRFDFPVLKGVFRVLTPDFDEQCRKDYTKDTFRLGIDNMPSPSHPKWNYRWRGEDKHDHMVFKSEERLGSLTFGGVGGMVLTGVFDSDWTFGKLEFIGRKTSPTPRSRSDDWERIEHEWNLREKSTKKRSKG